MVKQSRSYFQEEENQLQQQQHLLQKKEQITHHFHRINHLKSQQQPLQLNQKFSRKKFKNQ